MRSWRSAPSTAATSSSISCCRPWRTSSGMSSPAVLPSSSGARAEAPESVLGMVRLVEVVLKPGSRACPPFSSAGAQNGGQLSPGVAGAEASGNFHHCRGRELSVRRLVQPPAPPQRHQFRDTPATSQWPGHRDLPLPNWRLRTSQTAQSEAVVTIDHMLVSTGGGLDQSTAG